MANCSECNDTGWVTLFTTRERCPHCNPETVRSALWNAYVMGPPYRTSLDNARRRMPTEPTPEQFRDSLVIRGDAGRHRLFGELRAANLREGKDFQTVDFSARDPALLFTAGWTLDQPRVSRFWLQRPRGGSKTSDWAMDVLWLLWSAKRRIHGLHFAEDKDQANLLKEQMEMLFQRNPWLKKRISLQRRQAINRKTKSKLQIWSSDAASSWGATPDFISCDEFTHWTDHTVWESVFSSAGKSALMLVVLCNAGIGYGWQWRVKQLAQSSDRWYHSAPVGRTASFASTEELEEQRAVLSDATYRRVWLNEWQEGAGAFVTRAEAEACRDPSLRKRDGTQDDGFTYVAAVDYAAKRDRTVGVVMNVQEGEIIVDRMDVECPKVRGSAIPTSWVRDWMRDVRLRFGGEHGHVYFVIDEYQLRTIKEDLLLEGFDIETFDFASGKGNWELGVVLQQLILNRRVRWYEGCGRLEDANRIARRVEGSVDDLEFELSSLHVKEYQSGKRWRFEHLEDGVHHDDRAFALGAGCLFIVRNMGYGTFEVTPPSKAGEWAA